MTTHDPAPIALFAYARADHLERTVRSLLRNPEAARTALYVYCDAPRHAGHGDGVAAVRRYVDSIDGFASVQRVYRDANLGLARSVLDGVGHVLSRAGRVIVLEDDMVVSPHFLRYMNDGLARYESVERVASIHAYIYPVSEALPETFFLRGADCWGWATWSRAWNGFERDGRALLEQIKQRGLMRAFDFDWQYPYTGMLEDQIAGRNDSWAILWHASCFLRDQLTLYPGRTLVENIGNDASGTHCGTADDLSQPPSESPVTVGAIALEPSDIGRRAFTRFFAGRRTWQSRLRDTAKRWSRALA